eukprot:SAG31_NODE_1330_length_8749_cov_23.618844_8_plen_406_part_00
MRLVATLLTLELCAAYVQLNVKHVARMKGTFAHLYGTVIFESTPANLTLQFLKGHGGTRESLLTLSRHCLPGTAPCLNEGDQYVLFTAAPALRLVLIRGSTYQLPTDVNVLSKVAIDAYFARFYGSCHTMQDAYSCEPWASELSKVTTADEHTAIQRFFDEYDHQLSALEGLYDELYKSHEVTGHSYESAIPLFLTALVHASTRDSANIALTATSSLEPDVSLDIQAANYEAFRSLMTSPSANGSRRSLQQFSTNAGISFCMNNGFLTSYTTVWDGWNDCCGAVCGDNDANTCSGTCGSYAPDCSSSCTGMCGPSCNSCWPGICGDCCLWRGCYQHDNDCASYISMSCIGRSVQAVENHLESFGSRSRWCVNGYRTSTSGNSGGNTCRCEYDTNRRLLSLKKCIS